MSLIRNGGFERGNTDFWELISGGSLEISNISPLYGTYCGKFVSSGDMDEIILSKDYVEVSPYEIYNLIGYCKSASVRAVYPIFYLYDGDYSFIERIDGNVRWMDGTYQMMNSQLIVPVNTAYIRIGYRIHTSSSGEIFYFDATNLNRVSIENSISGVLMLLPESNITATGNTWDNKQDMKQFSVYYAELMCLAVSGTTPTLDVTVYESDESGNEIELGSFTQVTSATEERIDLPHTSGNGMYLRYTVGGTDPAFDVSVMVVGKR